MDTSVYVMNTYINVMGRRAQSGPARAPRQPSGVQTAWSCGSHAGRLCQPAPPGIPMGEHDRARVAQRRFLALGERRSPGDPFGWNRDERGLPLLVDDRAGQVAARGLQRRAAGRNWPTARRLRHDGHRELAAGRDRRDRQSPRQRLVPAAPQRSFERRTDGRSGPRARSRPACPRPVPPGGAPASRSRPGSTEATS